MSRRYSANEYEFRRNYRCNARANRKKSRKIIECRLREEGGGVKEEYRSYIRRGRLQSMHRHCVAFLFV